MAPGRGAARGRGLCSSSDPAVENCRTLKKASLELVACKPSLVLCPDHWSVAETDTTSAWSGVHHMCSLRGMSTTTLNLRQTRAVISRQYTGFVMSCALIASIFAGVLSVLNFGVPSPDSLGQARYEASITEHRRRKSELGLVSR